MLDLRAPDVLVAVVDVDVPRAVRIGDPGHRADERSVLGKREDPDVLALADVRSDLDCEARVRLEPLVPTHQRRA